LSTTSDYDHLSVYAVWAGGWITRFQLLMDLLQALSHYER
jgi:hypothetical protein